MKADVDQSTSCPFPLRRKRSAKQGELEFEEWTKDRIEENHFTNQVRDTVAQWRLNSWPGVTATSRQLLEHWTDPNRNRSRELVTHVAARRAVAEREAELVRARHAKDRGALMAKRDKTVIDIRELFSEFGPDPKGSTYGNFMGAWERVADGLEKRERDNRVLQRTQDSARNAPQGGSADEVVFKARLLWDGIEDSRELDARIKETEARIAAVEPIEIDENIVRYSNELTARGLVVRSHDSDFPELSRDLETRLEELGILGASASDEGAA